LAAEDPLRIRRLAHPGGERLGAAASRNLAIAAARGAYLAFLDADDLYTAEKLVLEVEILDRNPRAAMLYGPALWRWQDGRQPDRVDRIGIECGRIHNPPELVWRILLDRQGNVPCTCAVLVRTEAARAVGGFEPSFSLYEDQTLWAKIFLRHGVYVSPSAHSVYRQHEGSTSAEATRQSSYHFTAPHLAQRVFFNWVQHEAMRAGVDDPRLRRALLRAQLPYRVPMLGRLHFRWRRSIRQLYRALSRYSL
jgi:glycosyltransferase involved in cell wall biosynthesis